MNYSYYFKQIASRLHLREFFYNYYDRRLKNGDYPFLSAEEAIQLLSIISTPPRKSCIYKHPINETDCDLEIIVPCYNVEKYVEECIESILSQRTKYSFCITIINDGAKDNTRQIITKYESVPNVRIIDQVNQGLSGARNTGIAQAHGKYLLFIDSDDILIPDAIENLLTLASKTDADMIDSGHIRFADPITSRGFVGKIRNFIYNLLTKPTRLTYCEDAKDVSGFPCGKLIRTSLFSTVQFPVGYWFEDTIMWMIISPLCKKKATSDCLSFRYRMNPNSITHASSSNPKYLDSLYVTLQLLNDREQLGIEMTQSDYNALLYQIKINTHRISGLPFEAKYAAFIVHKNLLCDKYKNWNCGNTALKPIEFFLRNNEFDKFQLWCEWH